MRSLWYVARLARATTAITVQGELQKQAQEVVQDHAQEEVQGEIHDEVQEEAQTTKANLMTFTCLRCKGPLSRSKRPLIELADASNKNKGYLIKNDACDEYSMLAVSARLPAQWSIGETTKANILAVPCLRCK